MLTVPCIGKNVEQPELSCAAGGKMSDYLESLVFFSKVKHTTTIGPSLSSQVIHPRKKKSYRPKRNEICLCKNLFTDINSFIFKNQNPETIQMSHHWVSRHTSYYLST